MRRKDVKTEVDPDFEITDKLRAWADREAPQIDIDRETDRFIDHWLSTGEKKSSWDATWRNWMRRSSSMGGYLKSSRPRQAPAELTDEERKRDQRKFDEDMKRLRAVK